MKPIAAYFDGIFPLFPFGAHFDWRGSFKQRPIKADFDGILPPFHLWGPDRQILMTFCPLFIYGAQIGRWWWHLAPFSLMGPVRAYFDGILLRFDIWGPNRHILMAFFPVLTYVAHWGRFWWYFAPFWLMGPIEADFDDISPLSTYKGH